MTCLVHVKALIAVLWTIGMTTSVSPQGVDWAPPSYRYRIYSYKASEVSSYIVTEQRCCSGNLFPKVSNSYKRCCGGTEYDTTTDACCVDTISPKQVGFDCCNKQYFNVSENICCKTGIRPQLIKFPDAIRDSTLTRSNSQCCGGRLYDTRVQLCCPLSTSHTMTFRLVDKLYSNTICCKGKAFDARNGRCNENPFQILPFTAPRPIRPFPGQPFPTRPFPPPGPPFPARFPPPIRPGMPPSLPVPISRPMPRPFPGFQRFPPSMQPEFGPSFFAPVAPQVDGTRFQRARLNQCNGKPLNGATHLCCGRYNPNDNNPENELVIVSRTTVTTVCCGNGAYDFTKETCCDGKVHPTDMENPKTCCGNELYDPLTQWCCDAPSSTVATAKELEGDYCCGTEGKLYSYDKHICCGGQLLQIPEGTDSSVVSCCAGSSGESPNLYNTTHQKCCDGTVVELPDGTVGQRSQHLHCCGKVLINIRRVLCCNGQPMQRMGNQSCCKGNAVYNPATQLCCSKVIEKESPRHTVCCGEKAFNPVNQICCDNINSGDSTVVPRNRTFRFQLCCAGVSYDPTQESCCNGQLQAKDVLCCSMFDEGGVIQYSSVPKTNSTNRCCGLNEYNPRAERCCQNTAIPIDGDNYFCCGSSAYSSATHLCCGDTTFERAGEKPVNSCCGNVAYNTSIDICCGGHLKNRGEGQITGCCFPHQIDLN